MITASIFLLKKHHNIYTVGARIPIKRVIHQEFYINTKKQEF